MVRTGLRLAEQTSLARFELPDLDPARVQVPFWLPAAIAKRGSARWVYVPAPVLRAVWDYVELERAEAVERAQAAGRYERLDDALVVEDPSRPSAPLDPAQGDRVDRQPAGPWPRRLDTGGDHPAP